MVSSAHIHNLSPECPHLWPTCYFSSLLFALAAAFECGSWFRACRPQFFRAHRKSKFLFLFVEAKERSVAIIFKAPPTPWETELLTTSKLACDSFRRKLFSKLQESWKLGYNAPPLSLSLSSQTPRGKPICQRREK